MRLKLKYALPLAQIAMALTLLIEDAFWWQPNHSLSSGPSPYFSVLVAINAPAVIARAFWFLHVPQWCDYAALLVTIGLLWYWVALNVHSWQKERRAWTFSRPVLRFIADAALVGLGVLFAYLVYCDLSRSYNPPPSLGWAGFSIYEVLRAAWSAFLIFFFGCDLIRSIRIKRSVSGMALLVVQTH